MSESTLQGPRKSFTLKIRKFVLELGSHTRIMGILNLTPDSFSGDGLYKNQKSNIKYQKILDSVLNRAQEAVKDGADIIDVGGESSRPEAKPIPVEEELDRVIPVMKLLAKKINVPISIDTCKPKVAEQALDNGACIVNDISGLSAPGMPDVVKKYKAALVIMHSKGRPCNMQDNPRYESLIPEIIASLGKSIKFALDFGLEPDKIMIDPGIGFGKTLKHNLEIINRLYEFKSLGFPILVGPSRKSFIGGILNKNADERIFGTAAAVSLIIANGAHIIRVHDVREMSDVAKITDAISNQCPPPGQRR